MRGGRILWGQIAVVFAIVLVMTWAATQWVAFRLGFQSQLGNPWFELAGLSIYYPPAFFWWWFSFEAYAPAIFVEGGIIAVSGGLLAIAAAIFMSIIRSREARNVATYGSARWAEDREIRSAGLLDPDGVVLGRYDRAYLRHDGPEHVLCFAPTRSGKGVGLVVPTLLTWPASVDPNEERRRAEEEAARLSSVFFQTGARAGMMTAGSEASAPGLAGFDLGGQTAPAQDRHAAFLGQPVDRQTVAADRVISPASPFILQAGSVIPAAIITGVRSDLPGQITAQVTENVYDSPTGSLLLIPQGTRIIGQYDDGVTFGQRRILLVWNRLILPCGRSIVLERLPGAEASGYAGIEDGVDYHWWDLMKATGLSTLLGIGTELATDFEDRLIRAIRDGAQDTVNQAGQQIVQRQLQVAPTLTIRPGFPVRIIVTRDLVFEPAGGRP